jgi:hypothetical protein
MYDFHLKLDKNLTKSHHVTNFPLTPLPRTTTQESQDMAMISMD